MAPHPDLREAYAAALARAGHRSDAAQLFRDGTIRYTIQGD